MNEEPAKDLPTQILEFIGTLIIPDWGALIALMPVGVMLLVLAFLAFLGYRYWRAGEINRSRVPRRITAGPPPPGVHMPGPSKWPFVVPIAGAFVLWALALPPRERGGATTAAVNMPLLVIGLVIGFIAIVGWLRDAMKEWEQQERPQATHVTGALVPYAGTGMRRMGIGSGTGMATSAGTPTIVTDESHELVLPPGVHLPGPSPWPFFGPVALAVIFFGLVVGPVVVLAGVIMGIIAAVGWVRDAGHEFRQVEAGHAPEPVTRDPVRAFPLSLVRVYAAIAVVAVVLTVVPGLIGRVTGSGGGTANGGGGAPAGSPGPGGGGVVSDTLTISASNSQSFDQTEVKAAASKPLTINFDNKDQAAPHNVAITKATPEGDFIGQPLADAGKQVTYKTPALAAGEYSFYCSVHPNMKGTLTAE